MIAWLGVLLAYLLGSIPFGLVLVRVFHGADLRRTGSGNIGATNALRTSGVGLGVATLALDLAKGLAGVLLARALAGDDVHPVAAASIVLAPVLGHCFPVWLRGRGGKGVATALGVLLAVDPRLAAAGAVAFFVLAIPTRWVSLGSLGAAAAVVASTMIWHGLAPASVGVVIAAAIVVVRHRENIVRLLTGTEAKLGSK